MIWPRKTSTTTTMAEKMSISVPTTSRKTFSASRKPRCVWMCACVQSISCVGICASTKKDDHDELKNEIRDANKVSVFDYLSENDLPIENETNPLWFMKTDDLFSLAKRLENEIEEIRHG